MAGLVAPEIPPTQNPIAPFLSAFVASSAINAKRQQLENQLQMMALRNEKMQSDASMNQLKFGLAMTAEQRKAERTQDLYYLGQQGIAVREQGINVATNRLKLESDKAAADILDKQERLRRDALGLFTKQRLQYRGPRGAVLPADALENTDIPTDDKDLSAPGWHAKPGNPGKRFYNAPVYNPTTGQPLSDPNDPKKPILDPITIDNDTFGYLKGMHEATKRDLPTSRQVAPDPPTVQADPFPADPSQAVKDQPYTTPKGVLIWTGTGFRTP